MSLNVESKVETKQPQNTLMIEHVDVRHSTPIKRKRSEAGGGAVCDSLGRDQRECPRRATDWGATSEVVKLTLCLRKVTVAAHQSAWLTPSPLPDDRFSLGGKRPFHSLTHSFSLFIVRNVRTNILLSL